MKVKPVWDLTGFSVLCTGIPHMKDYLALNSSGLME